MHAYGLKCPVCVLGAKGYQPHLCSGNGMLHYHISLLWPWHRSMLLTSLWSTSLFLYTEEIHSPDLESLRGLRSLYLCSMTIRGMFLEENSSEQTASSFSLQPHYDSWEPEDTAKHEEMVLDTEEKKICVCITIAVGKISLFILTPFLCTLFAFGTPVITDLWNSHLS